MLLTWIIIALILAGIPATLLTVNLPLFQAPPPRPPGGDAPCVSVLIPARNEEAHIRAAAQSVLANKDITLELIILDDHSTDTTAEIIRTLESHDPRVRVLESTALPEGWCGKQHACWSLAQYAQYDLMVFMDADVEISPDALMRMAAFMKKRDLALGSGFPKQKTETFFEKTPYSTDALCSIGISPHRPNEKKQQAVIQRRLRTIIYRQKVQLYGCRRP